MKNIVVFASGSGTNFQSIIDACENQTLNARITGLISNKKDIGAIERAELHEIPFNVLSSTHYHTEEDYCRVLLKQLEEWEADLIVLAGYLRKIPECIIESYRNRILNIHPSLLPKYGGKGYYGLKVHQAVVDAGEAESGCTVHIVNEEFDKGPILDQTKVKVYEDDTAQTLAKRILKQEHILYPKVISNYLKKLS
ncbi:phosphoribosylglycinamide formyltransferase [Balneola sp. MJW-20]|uniref:phosphoribosylglycinamide formyltransferase n=1 Tax=Gracilimonas aurantiaca TaxID=3234185 RepID=UPI0034674204